MALVTAAWGWAAAAAPAQASPVLGPQIQVNVSTADLQAAPQVAIFPDGDFVVVWEAQAKANPQAPVVIHARLFHASGAAASGEFLLVRPLTGDVLLDGVGVVGDHQFVVLWDQEIPRTGTSPFSRVMMQLFDRSGVAVGNQVPVHSRSTSARYGGVLAVGAAGQIAVLWSGDEPEVPAWQGHTDLFARFFSPALAPRTAELDLIRGGVYGPPDDGEAFLPDAAAFAPDGSLLVASTDWGDDVDVVLMRYLADGSPAAVDALDEPCCLAASYDAAVAVAPEGTIGALWDHATPAPLVSLPLAATPARGIDGRFFSAGGTSLSSAPGSISRHPAGTLVAPRLAAFGGHQGFVALWIDESARDGDSSAVYGRLLDAGGTPLGLDFPVNVTTAGAQYAPGLAARGSAAVAVWVSGPDTTVYARRIGPGGS